jgi:hypothetical protein
MRDDTPPKGKGKKLLTVILIVANLLMLVIGIITIPPHFRGTAGKGEIAANTDQAPSNPGQDSESAATGSDNPAQSQNTQTPPAVKVNLSTKERPNLEDFLWYTEDVFYGGVPTDAAIIDNVQYTMGGWKGIIIYDPDNKHGANAMEFLNVDIAGTENNLSLTLDWYLMFISGQGESFDETDMEDTVFSGKWENGGLWASGAGTIRLTQFYELNGKQYAIGTMDTPDGIPAFIGLVRP